MNFKNLYPNLFQFFAGYFPDSDFENLTDEEVVLKYVSDCNRSDTSKEELQRTKLELEKLMPNLDKHWQEIGREANRHFESADDALKWLNIIITELNR